MIIIMMYKIIYKIKNEIMKRDNEEAHRLSNMHSKYNNDK